MLGKTRARQLKSHTMLLIGRWYRQLLLWVAWFHEFVAQYHVQLTFAKKVAYHMQKTKVIKVLPDFLALAASYVFPFEFCLADFLTFIFSLLRWEWDKNEKHFVNKF